MKRGKNNKAKFGTTLLRQISEAENIILQNISDNILKSYRDLKFVRDVRKYIYRTRIKNFDINYIRALSKLVGLISSEYPYGQNVYHDAPSIDNAFIPEEHKEELENETRKEQ
jgi:hypothetical protein